MKNLILSMTMMMALSLISAQSRINVGGGYFGHTITHPGLVFEMEYETNISSTMSLPFRIDLGFYTHPRNHNGLFLDFNYGFRRYFKSGLFLEQSFGLGVLATALNNDVFTVDKDGKVSETSKLNTPQLTPTVTLGLGYNITKQKENSLNLIWLRPKITWEIPHKTNASFSPALQIGFTHQIK